MGRMHSKGKGMSGSALPYKRTPPSWLKVTSPEVQPGVEQHGGHLCYNLGGQVFRTMGNYQLISVNDMICKLSKKGTTPSQIGVILRDHHGVGRVTSVTGTKILRILRKQGLAPEIPEDLYFMIKKAVSMRKHLEVFRKDRDAKFRLILVESRIHRLARYYKQTKKLPPNWKYESATASTLVS